MVGQVASPWRHASSPVAVGAVPVLSKDSTSGRKGHRLGPVKTPHNPLDSSAPLTKKGKQREVPKAKKPTSLKKVGAWLQGSCFSRKGPPTSQQHVKPVQGRGQAGREWGVVLSLTAHGGLSGRRRRPGRFLAGPHWGCLTRGPWASPGTGVLLPLGGRNRRTGDFGCGEAYF